MYITLAFDDDVLEVARAFARQQGSTLCALISGLARESLRSLASGSSVVKRERSGFPLLPTRNLWAVVDLQLVNQLRDELP